MNYKISCPNYKDLEGSQTVHIPSEITNCNCRAEKSEKRCDIRRSDAGV